MLLSISNKALASIWLIFHLTVSVSGLNVSLPKPIDEKFKSFPEAKACFNKVKANEEPDCDFWLSRDAGPVKSKCLGVDKVVSIPVFRVEGEYNVLIINCTASFPVDFEYHGVQPTEAMFVEWTKKIPLDKHLNMSEMETHQNFSVEVKIYSPKALFDYFSDPLNSYYERPTMPKVQFNYSRSGNYTFLGIFNKTIGRSFFMFLEGDGSDNTLLKNKMTLRVLKIGNQTVLPAIPSFSGGVVNCGPFKSTDVVTSFSVITGEDVNVHGAYLPTDAEIDSSEKYVCMPSSGKKGNFEWWQLDWIQYDFNETSEDPLLGNLKPEGTLEIDGKNPGLGILTLFLYPLCKTKDPFLKVNSSAVEMISVPAPNFGAMRLVQHFALPAYAKRSYTALSAREDGQVYDPLVREIKQNRGVNQRMGTIYCTNGINEKIVDFGAGIRTETFIPFGIGRDWAQFNRKESNIEVHFVLRPVHQSYADPRFPAKMYIGTKVLFECRANVPVVTKPLVWYIEDTNGTLHEDLIDYDLSYDTSENYIHITADLKAIHCTSSYWYSDFWRSISYEFHKSKVGEIQPPEISGLKEEYTFVEGLNSATIQCSASGTPVPDVRFEKGGKHLPGKEWEKTEEQVSIVLRLNDLSEKHNGIYTCVAVSKDGTEARKNFRVTVTSEPNTTTIIAAVITVSVLLLLLTVAGSVIYMKFYRTQKSGLTKQEIEEFMKGLKPEEAQALQLQNEGNDYAHEYAVMKPYVKEYEIPKTKFSIDESRVLGKGAFGLVLLGVVNQEEVAVKTVQRHADKQYLKALLSELKIMIHLGQHENLVPVIGAYTRDLRRGYVYVFVKYLLLGNLQNYLRNNDSNFDKNLSLEKSRILRTSYGFQDLLRWCADVANGMEYLGTKNVIHGDLAARNVLLDENKVAKVTDFGLSRQLYDYNDYVKKNQEPLPWRWMALEALKYMSFSKKSDCWSYGVLMWEVFSLGEVPYPGYSWNLDFVEELENGLRMSKPKHATAELFGIMLNCWNHEPVKRPGFANMRDIIRGMMTPSQEEDKVVTFELIKNNLNNTKRISIPNDYANDPVNTQKSDKLNTTYENEQK